MTFLESLLHGNMWLWRDEPYTIERGRLWVWPYLKPTIEEVRQALDNLVSFGKAKKQNTHYIYQE